MLCVVDAKYLHVANLLISSGTIIHQDHTDVLELVYCKYTSVGVFKGLCFA